jgi:hypothetical protein
VYVCSIKSMLPQRYSSRHLLLTLLHLHIAASATEQPEDHWQQPVAQLPAQPVPLNRQSPLGHPGGVQQPSQPNAADTQSRDEPSPPVQPQLSRDEPPQQGGASPMSASPAASTPVGVSPSESHDDEAIRPLSTAAPLRFAAGNGPAPPSSPTTAPISGEEVSPPCNAACYGVTAGPMLRLHVFVQI